MKYFLKQNFSHPSNSNLGQSRFVLPSRHLVIPLFTRWLHARSERKEKNVAQGECHGITVREISSGVMFEVGNKQINI